MQPLFCPTSPAERLERSQNNQGYEPAMYHLEPLASKAGPTVLNRALCLSVDLPSHAARAALSSQGMNSTSPFQVLVSCQ